MSAWTAPESGWYELGPDGPPRKLGDCEEPPQPPPGMAITFDTEPL